MKTNSWISGLCALLILIGISSSSLAAPTPQAESLFQQGNDLYGQGKYREALQIYISIAAREGVSAALLYNIGNSYAQTGQPRQGQPPAPGQPDRPGHPELPAGPASEPGRFGQQRQSRSPGEERRPFPAGHLLAQAGCGPSGSGSMVPAWRIFPGSPDTRSPCRTAPSKRQTDRPRDQRRLSFAHPSCRSGHRRPVSAA